MNDKPRKPEGMAEEHFHFLDQLQSSGKTNMMGAGPYLQKRFHLSDAEAKTFVLYWIAMKSREDR